MENGWVSLTGQVDYEYQRTSASNSVRILHGVNGISNNITVKPRVDVKNVKQTIEAALVRDAELDANHIQVDADNGTVTLSGDVHSFFEKQAAGKAAWRSSGVTYVQNNIRVV